MNSNSLSYFLNKCAGPGAKKASAKTKILSMFLTGFKEEEGFV